MFVMEEVRGLHMKHYIPQFQLCLLYGGFIMMLRILWFRTHVGIFLLVVFAALLDVLIPTHSAIVLAPPKSVNAIEGDPVAFSCTVMAEEIDFFVDGEIPNEPSVVHKEFSEGFVIDINDTTKQQTLTAIAHTNNNNTNITCRALTIKGRDISLKISDPAVLLVQGPLASVVNLSYSFIDSFTVNVSWSSPFTLPGTDIIGYNVLAKQFYDGGINSTGFTMLEHYLFLNYSQCNKITITVSGFNGLKGENTSITIDPSSTQNELPVSCTFDLSSSYEYFILKRLYLNISNLLCPGEYPTRVNLTILYNNGTLVTTVDNIPLVSTNDTNILATPNNDTITLLSVDNDYAATVAVSYLDNTINSVIILRTCAAIQVIANDTTGPSVTFVCHFSSYSDAIGCLIELLYSNDTTVRFNGTGTRTGDDVAIVTIDGIHTAGVYELLVYEIEGDQTTLVRRGITISISISSLVEIYASLPVSSTVLQTITTMTTTALDPYVNSSAAITSSSVNAPTDKTEPNSSLQLAVPYIAVGVTLLILIVLLIAILWPVICCLKKSKKQKKLSPITDINSAYLNPRTLIFSLPTNELMEKTISIDQNPSYAQVHISKPTEEHVYEKLHSRSVLNWLLHN